MVGTCWIGGHLYDHFAIVVEAATYRAWQEWKHKAQTIHHAGRAKGRARSGRVVLLLHPLRRTPPLAPLSVFSGDNGGALVRNTLKRLMQWMLRSRWGGGSGPKSTTQGRPDIGGTERVY